VVLFERIVQVSHANWKRFYGVLNKNKQ